MTWVKQSKKIYCCFTNYCTHKNLCCSFCKVKTCEKRCLDCSNKCAYLTDEINEIINFAKPTVKVSNKDKSTVAKAEPIEIKSVEEKVSINSIFNHKAGVKNKQVKPLLKKKLI